MMTSKAIRTWSFVHKWTSLACTVFMLMLCLTGMPLIFHHEIDHALEGEEWVPANPSGPLLDLDRVLDRAIANRPGEVPVFMSFDEDRPVVNITTAPRPDSPESEMHFASFDRTSGDLVPPATGGGFMDVLLQLHTDMFLGLPGMLFLGLMGVLFTASIISGVVLYAPFTRKLEFGTVRVGQSRRVKWLDWHNLLGIVTVAWVLVVGLTGVVNTLATPIIGLWRAELARELTVDRAAGGAASGSGSVHAAVEMARQVAPGNWVQFVAFPGGSFSTDRHFAVFLQGNTPVTKHTITPVLVDATTGAFDGLREMPWYAKALSLSQPLHFGDYGGLPLKILWALLNTATIVVLGSGIYLWLRRPSTARVPQQTAGAPVGARAEGA